jgi:hypothetical protein
MQDQSKTEPAKGLGLEQFLAPDNDQHAPQLPLQTNNIPAPARRGRARSSTLVGAQNPLEFPVTTEEQQVANLARAINRARRTTGPPAFVEDRPAPATNPAEADAVVEAATRAEASPPTTVGRATTPEAATPANSPAGFTTPINSSAESATPVNSPIVSPLISPIHRPRTISNRPPPTLRYPSWSDLINNRPSPRLQSDPFFQPQIRLVELPLPPTHLFALLQRTVGNMQPYPNYLDSPQTGSGPNPRQAPPSPSPGMHQNGMNGGGMGLAGGMVGFPTPAGHQSDLNYIMQMVEELAGQLAHNQGLTAGIVEKMGKVRAKAKNMDLSNDELIAIAASELNGKYFTLTPFPSQLTSSTETSENLEKENSELRNALEKALCEKKENWKLAIHGANILSDILDKMHKFKSQHEADTLAWHRNYRKQLADEREENLNLRNQINDMKAAACRANEHLRQMRRYLTDHDELNELRIQNIQLRQERRLWKRMALPLVPQDDSEWSDDDDIIDPEEKKRKFAEEAEKERKDKENGQEGGDAQGPGA